ncbi:MAG: hypothetical protein RI885_1360 [Actinomycetota bacterium]|jgi:hypothetical protein
MSEFQTCVLACGLHQTLCELDDLDRRILAATT